jgi:hypothetical protein
MQVKEKTSVQHYCIHTPAYLHVGNLVSDLRDAADEFALRSYLVFPPDYRKYFPVHK